MSRRLYYLKRSPKQTTLTAEDLAGADGKVAEGDQAKLAALLYLAKLPFWRDNHAGNTGADWCVIPPEQLDRRYRGILAVMGLKYTGAHNGEGRLNFRGWTYYCSAQGRYRRYRMAGARP